MEIYKGVMYDLRSFFEVVSQQLQGMCMHMGSADGGTIPYGLRGVHIGIIGTVILAIHSFHGLFYPAGLNNAITLQDVHQVLVGLA